MILSYDQITQATACLDCARRKVDVQTFPDVPSAFESLGLCTHLIEACDDEDCERCTREIYQPVNLVWVHHDPGCPRLCYDMYGVDHPVGDNTDVISIHPVDIGEDHPWLERLSNL